MNADIVIIGGGVMGASIAWNLAKRGAGRVLLLERDSLAGGATGKSSAIVRTHYTHEVLARMALHAREIFEDFYHIVGGDAGFHRTGFVVIVSPNDVETVHKNVAMNNRVGINARVLTPEELGALELRLDASPEFTGAAAWEPDSGYADPHLTANAFANAARRAGATIRTGVQVDSIVGKTRAEGVETSEGRINAGAVIVAAGYRTRDLVAPLGFDVPLTPVRHTMAVVQRTSDFGEAHPTISDRVFGVYLRPDVGDITLVGTTAPYDGQIDFAVEQERRAADEQVQEQAARFLRRFPSQQGAGLRGGFTGIYDCSPDVQPLLGPILDVAGLHIACGFSGHGFKLSPVVGELMAEKVLYDKTTLVDIDFFNPARFVLNQPIEMQYAYSVQTL
jgi:sarcosine oxidase subunit beta